MATPWLQSRFARPLRVEILPDMHARPISPDDLARHAGLSTPTCVSGDLGAHTHCPPRSGPLSTAGNVATCTRRARRSSARLLPPARRENSPHPRIVVALPLFFCYLFVIRIPRRPARVKPNEG